MIVSIITDKNAFLLPVRRYHEFSLRQVIDPVHLNVHEVLPLFQIWAVNNCVSICTSTALYVLELSEFLMLLNALIINVLAKDDASRRIFIGFAVKTSFVLLTQSEIVLAFILYQ